MGAVNQVWLRLLSLTKIQLVMASLQDYGIRVISHGEWSDPEVEWEKSKFQTLLFNYWDVAGCTEYDNLCESEDDADLQELVSQLWELTPSGYNRPQVYYGWEVSHERFYSIYDNSDYYEDYGLSDKEDFVLHNTSQALKQALQYLEDNNYLNADIQIFRRDGGERTLVANYSYQGSTLKDCMCYGKK